MRQLRAETSVSTANIAVKCREQPMLQVDKLLLLTHTHTSTTVVLRSTHRLLCLLVTRACNHRRRNQRKNLVASSTGCPPIGVCASVYACVCVWWMLYALANVACKTASPRIAIRAFSRLSQFHAAQCNDYRNGDDDAGAVSESELSSTLNLCVCVCLCMWKQKWRQSSDVKGNYPLC